MRVSARDDLPALYVQGRGGLRRELHTLPADRAGAAPPPRAARAAPGRSRHGHDQRAARRGRRPGRARPLGRRPDHRQDGNSAIGTLVERSTRYVLLLHLPDGHGAESVATAMPPDHDPARAPGARSPGTRAARWPTTRQFTIATGSTIYFCDPHRPWQRGSNENTNGLLRQYFPKGTDLPSTREHLARSPSNSTADPRNPRLETPAEALNELLSKPFNTDGVAHPPESARRSRDQPERKRRCGDLDAPTES